MVAPERPQSQHHYETLKSKCATKPPTLYIKPPYKTLTTATQALTNPPEHRGNEVPQHKVGPENINTITAINGRKGSVVPLQDVGERMIVAGLATTNKAQSHKLSEITSLGEKGVSVTRRNRERSSKTAKHSCSEASKWQNIHAYKLQNCKTFMRRSFKVAKRFPRESQNY